MLVLSEYAIKKAVVCLPLGVALLISLLAVSDHDEAPAQRTQTTI